MISAFDPPKFFRRTRRLTDAAEHVGAVFARANDPPFEMTDADRADFDDLLVSLAVSVDSCDRRGRDDLCAREAIRRVLELNERGELDPHASTLNWNCYATRRGDLLVAALERLERFDADEIAAVLADIEASAREYGVLTSLQRVQLARAVQLLRFVAQRGTIGPLLRFPGIVRKWTALLWALVARRELMRATSVTSPAEEPAGGETQREALERAEAPPPLAVRCSRFPIRTNAPPSSQPNATLLSRRSGRACCEVPMRS
jgi:hypothetical protein